MHRGSPVDLVPELAYEDVHRPVAVRRTPSPDALQQLVPRGDAATRQRQRVEETELRRRQFGAVPVQVRLDVGGVETELLDLHRVAGLRLLRPDAAARRGTDAG